MSSPFSKALEAANKARELAMAVAKAYVVAGGEFEEKGGGVLIPKNPALYDDCKAAVLAAKKEV